MADPIEATAPVTAPSHGHDEEKARLDALLKNRPEAKELQDKNILPNSNAAPSLLAKQEELRKAQLEDRLADRIEHRPDRAELERLGILKSGSSSIAPGLQAKQEELRKAQLEDRLERELEKRPERTELEERGILKGGQGVAPGLMAKQEELKRAQLGDRVKEGVEGRPSREELESRGILHKGE
ncbi:hypothetical protein BDZ90DRAFT_255716 [Jaminaea rosea]|uniref:RPEL repeat protein n=1 Tax=Jaminaea rosea TaxID=1569628 RepID=A0A316UKW9_9BASI|nr:hypothetical protein BDZ90DRAFT_255716 [Jaminaea rosea]PWN25448.1 hypothetical protein BDZ90DRAFT_255716 [Jaminaea rosea]